MEVNQFNRYFTFQVDTTEDISNPKDHDLSFKVEPPANSIKTRITLPLSEAGTGSSNSEFDFKAKEDREQPHRYLLRLKGEVSETATDSIQ